MAKVKYVYPRQLPNIKLTPDEALECIKEHAGITLREHYAGLAMQGIMSKTVINLRQKDNLFECVTDLSIELADRLIHKLEKGQ